MLTPQFVLSIAASLVVDLFAGGGGASTGIEQAIGRHVDIAVNHDPEAISLHTANHPQTTHYTCDVFELDPREIAPGQPIGLLWASPDCKHFSKAKGGKPVSKKIRGLAWVVVDWAKARRPSVICLENVEEFQTWGPLDENNLPDPARKGETFREFVAALQALGYVVEWRELRACDYGAPTIRKRLFLVARLDGMPIVWPEATHARPDSLPVQARKLQPWRTAADCIDWSIPCPSIFTRARPLADATLRRVARGVERYVIGAAEPFIVPIAHYDGTDRVHATSEPLRTIKASTKGGEFALAMPTLVQTGYGERAGQAPRALDLGKPLGTVVSGQKHALVAAFLAQHNNHRGTVPSTGRPASAPISTITGKGAQQTLVTAHITKFRTGSTGHALDEPLHTITANGHVKRPGGAAPLGLVSAFLMKYYGTDQDPQLAAPLHTVTTKHRFALVTVQGVDYEIVDIGLRMLTPRELYRAQGFPESYAIDYRDDGQPLTKTAQVRMCGNSVCPPLARAIVAANYNDSTLERIAA
jgi:DNA (cytosine-5)-methyltransferase 1